MRGAHRHPLVEGLEGLGRVALLAREAIGALLHGKFAWQDLLFQIHFMGVKSQSVVLVTGAFTGMCCVHRRSTSSTR